MSDIYTDNRSEVPGTETHICKDEMHLNIRTGVKPGAGRGQSIVWSEAAGMTQSYTIHMK